MLPNNKPVAKYCPECKTLTKLIIKTNSHTDEQFLGCPNFPKCRHTQEISEEMRMRVLGQKELF
jgi:ssDNA-binding Zn-finger/Zn-ribbon topoisomerase 1